MNYVYQKNACHLQSVDWGPHFSTSLTEKRHLPAYCLHTEKQLAKKFRTVNVRFTRKAALSNVSIRISNHDGLRLCTQTQHY